MRIRCLFLLLLLPVVALAQGELKFMTQNTLQPSGIIAEVNGMELPCIPYGTVIIDTCAYIHSSAVNVTIDSITFNNSEYFTLISPSLPAYLYGGDTVFIVAKYNADAVGMGYDTTTIHFYTQGGAGELTALVTACVQFVGSVNDGISSDMNELSSHIQNGEKFGWLTPTPNPALSVHPVSFMFGLSHSADVALELFDISGKRAALIASERFAPGIHKRYLETKVIAKGAYIYRYTIEGKSYTGKLVVE